MSKLIALSTVTRSAHAAHIATDRYTIDVGGYRGADGWLIIKMVGGRVLRRRANFDATCGQSCFYWVRIDGVKYLVDYLMDVHRVDVATWASADQDEFFKTGNTVIAVEG